MDITLIEMAVSGAGLVSAVAWLLHRQRREVDHYRRTFQVFFPRELGHDNVLNFMRALSGLPSPKPFHPPQTVVFDTYADETGVKHFLSVPGHLVRDVEGFFRAHIGGSLIPVQDDPI